MAVDPAAYLITILLSLAPISEVRGGIPYAIIAGMNPVVAFVLAAASNILVAPIAWLLLDISHHIIEHVPSLRSAVDSVLHRAQYRVHDKVERYGHWGLALFVAVPFPLTGAWTGAIAAWALGVPRWRAFLAIVAGVLISSFIVTLIVLSGSKTWQWILG